MSPLDYIFIADSCSPRMLEMKNLCEGFAPEILTFDGSKPKEQTATIKNQVDTILGGGGKIMLITNCIMGVQEKVFHLVRGSEARHNNGARKILLTCKSGAQVNKGLKQRGISRVGLRHVHWDGEDTRKHQDDMRRILRSTVPIGIQKKPWEPLKNISLIMKPDSSDEAYQRLVDSFPLEGQKFLGYVSISGKRFLVGERDGAPWIYTQMHD